MEGGAVLRRLCLLVISIWQPSRPGIMAVTMINLAGRVVTWSSGNTAYVSKLFLSCGTIDFSLSCCRCQHYVLVYHAGLSVYTVHLYTPINMFPPAPHAELAALSAPSQTVVVARLVLSVAAAHCCCDLHGGGRGSPRHSGAGGDEASSWSLWWRRILEPLERASSGLAEYILS